MMATTTIADAVAAQLRQIDHERQELRRALDSLLLHRELVEARYPARRRLGDRVRQARIELGVSQRMLARIAGLHPSTIGRIERGANSGMSGRTARSLLIVFGPSFDLNVWHY